jgi:putative membrane protein
MLATVVRIAVVAVALWVATLLVPGIEVTAGSTEARVGTLLAVALVFGVVNAVVKPVVQVLGCAFYILTLGLTLLLQRVVPDRPADR